MNLSLDTILTNARELVSRLRRDDAVADSAVNQAQYVHERILGMKEVFLSWFFVFHRQKSMNVFLQYGDKIAELNEIIAHRPKTTILFNIQKENRLIKLKKNRFLSDAKKRTWLFSLSLIFFYRQLQQENEELRQLVTEHRSVLEKVMYKYRQDIQRLILAENEQIKAKTVFNSGLAKV